LAVLKFNDDFQHLLIGAEGTASSENANAFPSCVGRFEEAVQCPADSPHATRKESALDRKQQTSLHNLFLTLKSFEKRLD
jgi:hypothetical protein